MRLTAAERLARYRARPLVHLDCGVRTTTRPAGCLRCVMVSEYRARREHYRDLLERSDEQNERETPIEPKVTFRWWLRQYQYPTPH